MNVLDENVPLSQQQLLKRWRIHTRQIGVDAGWKGMKDHEVIPLLLEFNRPTFFTLDRDFYRRRLCHDDYCLVFLEVDEDRFANYVRRFFRHPALNSKAKSMGKSFACRQRE